ncbi:MAG TPA: 50S ribosomal protein L17 [Candidatus Polarisedimenticolia bacterium]
MRHGVRLRKLGRTSSHRRALLRSLSTSLFRYERITTTLPKAKELRPFAERLITLARRDDLHARRQVVKHVSDRDVVKKLFDTLGPRFATRPGGYTRTLKLGPRLGDGAELAIVELIGSEPTFKKQKDEKKSRREKKAKGEEKTTGAHEGHDHDTPGADAESRRPGPAMKKGRSVGKGAR